MEIMTYVSYNKLFNQIANDQLIEPGTEEWRRGGLQPFSGQTGGHWAYGWSSDWKVDAFGTDWAKAVIANYGHRRSYYLGAPFRKNQYENAGRPIDWAAEDSQDLPNGKTAYITTNGLVEVSGPDPLHFHLQPLYTLMDRDDLTVKVYNQDFPAAPIAKTLAQFLSNSLAGMLKKQNGAYHFYGNRASACIVFTALNSLQRGALFLGDDDRFGEYLEEKLLPFFETAPGFNLGNKHNPFPGKPYVQLYNGLYWLLPAFYDLWKALQADDIKERVWTLISRWSQYMKDIDDISIAGVQLDPSVMEGDVAPTWNGLIVDTYKDYDWTLWGLRAQYVAAAVLIDGDLQAKAQANLEKVLPKKMQGNNRSWLYDADMNYLGE